MKGSLLVLLLLGASALAQPVPTSEKNSTDTQPVGSPSEQQTSAVAESTVVSPLLSYRRSVPTYTPKYDAADYASPYPATTCHGHTPGYYGNPHHGCKIFHICQEDGRLETFDCPPYTKFNNYLLVCDWPFKVDYNCDPIYKDEEYPAQSYNTAYPVDKSYLPNFLNLYPIAKPLYAPVPYVSEKAAPAFPVIPIYNAHAKSYKAQGYEKSYVPVAPVYEAYGEKPYISSLPHYKKPAYVRELSYKSYDKPSYAEKPAYGTAYEKPALAEYAVEKAPVHVVYPVVKSYPTEKVGYDMYQSPKTDYVYEKPIYRNYKPAAEKAYKEPYLAKEEYSSYAPEKTVVLPLYPRDAYESVYNAAPYVSEYKAPVYNAEYKEEKYIAQDKSYVAPAYDKSYPNPAYVEKSYSAPTYDKSYSAPAYPEKAYPAPVYAEKSYIAPAYPEKIYSAPVEKSYSAPAYPEKVYSAPAYAEKSYDRSYTSTVYPEYEKYSVSAYPVQHDYRVSSYAPEKSYDYKVDKYAVPAYPAYNEKSHDYKVPAYGPEKVYDYKVDKHIVPPYPVYNAPSYGPEVAYDYKNFEKYGKYPTTVASYAAAMKNYADHLEAYGPAPYANYRSRLASILKSY